jgi:hypothetical protein
MYRYEARSIEDYREAGDPCRWYWISFLGINVQFWKVISAEQGHVCRILCLHIVTVSKAEITKRSRPAISGAKPFD